MAGDFGLILNPTKFISLFWGNSVGSGLKCALTAHDTKMEMEQ